MIARPWRVLRTGIAFAAFGLYSLGIFATAVPWVRLTVRDPRTRQRRVQATVNRAFRHFMALMRGLGLMTQTREGTEALAEPGALVVANHPTLIDAVAILSEMPEAVVVTKVANARNPFMGGTIRGAGYIANDNGRAMIEASAQRLREGNTLVLFPEGTRSPRGGLGPFQRGTARIALETERDLVPVVARCDPPTLMKGQPWYDVPDRPFDYRLRVEPTIRIQPYLEAISGGEPRASVARRLTAEIREVFEKVLFKSA